MRALIPLVALVFVACGEDAPAAPSPAPGPAAQPAAESDRPEESPPAPAEESPAPSIAEAPELPSAADLDRQAREDAVIVRRARAAAREDQFDEALTLIEPLLEREPPGRRVFCEAGYYAHRADQLERAETLLDQGLRLHGDPSRVKRAMRNPLAMCLYNRGRLHEARGERGPAASAYRESLRLRSNDIVRQRLEALGEQDEVAYVTAGLGRDAPLPRRGTGPDLDRAVRSTAGAVCEAASEVRGESGSERACGVDRAPVPVTGDGPEAQWVVYSPSPAEDDYRSFEDVAYVAITTDDGAVVLGPAAMTSRAYQYAIMPAVHRARWRDLDGDGTAELFVETRLDASGSEDGCHDDNSERELFVARRGADGWEGMRLQVADLWVAVCYGDGDEDETETASPLWEAELTFAGGGRLRFHNAEHDVSFTLDELFTRCAEHPDDCTAMLASGEEG